MKNELQRHKRSDKIKWAFTGIAFVLLFVMVTGLCLQLFGNDKVKPSNWFKKSDTEQTQPAEGEENETAQTGISMLSSTVTLDNDFVGDNSGFVTWVDPHDFVSYEYSGSVFFKSLGERVGLADIYFHCTEMSGYWGYRLSINVNTTCGVGSKEVGSYILHFPNGNTWDITDFNEYEKPMQGYKHARDQIPVAYFGKTSLDTTYICLPLSGSGSSVSFGDDTDGFYVECVPKTAALPADPVKEGYTFVGWYYDEAYTQPYDGEPIYEDTALYAKFEINRYTVTFNSDGGSAVASQTVDWNTAATLTTPTREGYTFKGWYLPNGTQYTNQPIKADTTLTAQWERNVFTVTFETDGGSAVASQEVNLNSSVTLPTTTRTGYVFKGWYLADGTEYTDQGITADITLTAHWEVQTFTVTFYVDGEVYETMTVDYGTSLVPVASELNLNVMSVISGSGAPSIDEEGTIVVEENCFVEAVKMNTVDQTINTVKQNKWAIIGGVVGGVALIAVVAAICGGVKHKRKR